MQNLLCCKGENCLIKEQCIRYLDSKTDVEKSWLSKTDIVNTEYDCCWFKKYNI